MKITGWTQASDYSSTELGEVSFEQAADAVVSFPWTQRLHEFGESVLRKEDACPPGVGFDSDEKSLFHVYAVALDEWQLYVSLPRRGKILGLFRKPPKTIYSELKALKQAVEFLRLFFDRESERLCIEAAKVRRAKQSAQRLVDAIVRVNISWSHFRAGTFFSPL